MRSFVLTILLAALEIISLAQTPVIKRNNIDDFSTDALQQVYTLSGNVLAKYNPSGKLLQEFSYSIYGQITSFDVSNPLRILVFYQEANALLFLNQQMTIIGDPIELDQIGDIQAQQASTSNQGGFWIFDEFSQSLIYYDANRVQRYQSQDLASLGEKSNPVYLQEKANNVYLSIADKTLVFDQFGGYESQIPTCIKGNIHPSKNSLAFWSGSKYLNYHTLLKELKTYELPDTNAEKVAPAAQEWLILKQNQIVKYKQ